MNLDTARIFVWDIVEAKRFYADRLGLAVQSYSEEHGVCIFDTGGTKFVVEAVSLDAAEDDRSLVGRFTGLSFSVVDIQSKHQELSSLGVRFSGAPELQYWGGWLATLDDPAGNSIQFVQHPS